MKEAEFKQGMLVEHKTWGLEKFVLEKVFRLSQHGWRSIRDG